MFGRLAAVAALTPLLAGGPAAAQPAVDPTPPAAIHGGTCAATAPDPAYSLGELRAWPFVGAGEDLPAAGAGEGVEPVAPSADVVGLLPPSVLGLTAEVEAGFEALFGTPHAVVVERGGGDDRAIACGELVAPGGERGGEEAVVIGLRPRNGSGFYGYAVIERGAPADAVADATTDVTLYLFHGLDTRRDARSTAATPAP